MKKKAFKAESKRLLELMINSIYTHKEIFLRELISNASDAIDKLYYHSLKDGISGLAREDFYIEIKADKENRTLSICDNGIGMTAEELEKNLGTIAQSDSRRFKEEEGKDEETAEEIDVIGQFGVGFYSAFMVASEITVISKAYGSDEAHKWQSEGVEGYTIEPCEKQENGTLITLKLKPDGEDEQYSRYLEQYELRELVKKYSDYIRYPIKMETEKERLVDGSEDEYETYTEKETLNSMVPLWKRRKSEVSEEEYNRFYQDNFYDYTAPAKVIHMNTEGSATFSSLLFIPSARPYDFMSSEAKYGLKLYASGVLISECCEDLLPECFRFVRGLVDSQDLSLNISREMLQHDRQLKLIAGRIENKVKNELKSMLTNDKDKYIEFFKNFGIQLKYSIYSSFGSKKELLGDLLIFRSSADDSFTTLSEYCERMRESQKYIYYACGADAARIAKLPQTERLTELGYEVLYLTDDVDEFTLRTMHDWNEKEFRSVSGGDLGLDDELSEKKEPDENEKTVIDAVAAALGEKISRVSVGSQLGDHLCCLTTEGGISLEMEKVYNAMPGLEQKVRAQRVLELNAEHPVFEKLVELEKNGDELLSDYAALLYGQSLLEAGMEIEDPEGFSKALARVLAK